MPTGKRLVGQRQNDQSNTMKKEETEAAVLNKMAALCSLKEYCVGDIRQKIADTGLTDETNERIIRRLCADKFIDEKRYVRAFIKDKFRFNQWGRVKINYALRNKGIQKTLIETELNAIDESEYNAMLENLIQSKMKSIKGKTPRELFQKLFRFASGRGFESWLIIPSLKKILNTENNEYDLE